MFGIVHICANFGLVIVSSSKEVKFVLLSSVLTRPKMDTSYFIKAFSANPAAVVPGYTIGGIAYFAIPWALGTLMSSVVLGLENNPVFPTYPRVSILRNGNGVRGELTLRLYSRCPNQKLAPVLCYHMQH